MINHCNYYGIFNAVWHTMLTLVPPMYTMMQCTSRCQNKWRCLTTWQLMHQLA